MTSENEVNNMFGAYHQVWAPNKISCGEPRLIRHCGLGASNSLSALSGASAACIGCR